MTSRHAPQDRSDERGFVERHPFASFVAIAYAFSWTLWAIAFAGGGRLPYLAGVFGPAVAAYVVLRLTGGSLRAWARSCVHWRVPLRWWAYALGLPVALFAAVSLTLQLLGRPVDWSLALDRGPAYAATWFFVLALGGGLEEPGWRGFGLPHLLETHSPVRATLIIGLVWGVWHVPVYGSLGFVIPMVLAFFYTFLWAKTQSVLLAIVLHASFTPAQDHLILLPRDEAYSTVLDAPDFAILGVYLAAVALLVLLTRGRLGVPAPRTADPELTPAPAASPGQPANEGVTMYPLIIEHVTKSYRGHVVVDDLTFTAQPGRVTGFLGPNGAGKSTTMKILLDLAAADKGTTAIGERRYRDLKDPVRTVGVVLEPNAFHPGRSGRNHLRILADAAGISTARVDEVLHQVDIAGAADRRVGGYSLGMRQRLSLAAALLGDPPVLVLDEPGNGLDPQGIHDLRTLLRGRAAQGHTVFVSSHLLAEVEQLADDLVVVDEGRLVTTGALQDLQRGSVTVRTPRATDLALSLVAAGASVQRPDEDTLNVTGMAAAAIGDLACDAQIPLHELASGPGSLEDLFLGWTSHAPSRIPAQSRSTAQKEVVSS